MTATPSLLKTVFPDFADVDDAVVQYWLDLALETTGAWENDHATMLLAAHNMAINGIGAGSDMTKLSSVSSLKSGALSLSFKSSASSGEWGRSTYGSQFYDLLRARAGGPFVTDTGPIVGGPYGLARY